MKIAEKHHAARQHILKAAKPLIGQRGFSAVGLTQILDVAGVPKGSFYHYFESKEVFGEELLRTYIEDYLVKMDDLFENADGNAAEKIARYCQFWRDTHLSKQIGNKCLIVKLAAEVCDLSERMRAILEGGTRSVIDRLSALITAGQGEGSIGNRQEPEMLAASLYQLWLGSTLIVKITHSSQPFDQAWQATKRLLEI
ncbi:TetR family transcriptional regulator [Acetobacter pasteurianus]|uniref:Transcriptional regulator AcuR n=1 Tax=Acetobacter pasteurianus subsp. pasteurianus TaxID=481145 RepID=A0A1Y0YET5_ACEPA|nr:MULTISPECIES: TetR/AcrR family transcriptional regulator [Acetobacter]RCL04439.1 TetR family transcriptional regulator [Acetobacter pasteurianus]ARW49455.1 Transcriptional regulator AcuR [Acetobacter pasteurianus subsp. pasteurianus]MCP1217322.1 TetR/AcrR family transcriptional regulator [Acetobacter orientalis]MCP1220211.1 TetR/AcrR family transcriptional regulator [Acetobacter orientalis]GAB32060.1 transcriptional regulator TetR [Acetobacter pasteurianus subsp. pasteurianus LMG 1262 = NBR